MAVVFMASMAASHELEAKSGWVPQPKGRGTLSIVFSSTITLALCVWTAIHLDIVPKSTPLKRFRRKLAWMFTGIFAPEALFVIAMTQWMAAKSVNKEWCSHHGVKRGSREDVLRMECAFFAGMGGYTLGLRDDFSGFPATLSSSGFLHFAKLGIIPPSVVHRRLILDKGKADGLGKTLVCIQALWLAIQCVVRKASGLPITLLELHVVMHVLYTVIIYAFWWYKPLDVSEPIVVVEDRELASLLAVLYGKHASYYLKVARYKTEAGSSDSKKTTTVSPFDLDDLVIRQSGGDFRKIPPSTRNIHFVKREDSSVTSFVTEHKALGKTQFLETLPVQDEAVFRGESLIVGNEFLVEISGGAFGDDTCTLSKADVMNLRLAAAAIRSGLYTKLEEDIGKGDSSRNFVIKRADTTRDDIDEKYRFDPVNACILLLPPIYGACHATAWNSHFPTPIEQWMWRICSIIVGGVPLLVGSCGILQDAYDFWVDLKRMLKFLKLYSVFVVVGVIVSLLAALVLGAARLFLLVEAFLSLRSLPVGSYESTPWEEYLPHVG